jgi:hypothetical protein
MGPHHDDPAHAQALRSTRSHDQLGTDRWMSLQPSKKWAETKIIRRPGYLASYASFNCAG